MKNKKAISLIVLIITIIVMIILASAIIMSLDNANIFEKAEEAVDKTNAATNKYLSEIKLAERELEKIQGASPVTDTTPNDLRQEDDTYYIESIDDLVTFSNRVNGGETFEGKTVKVTRLLDFNSDNSYVDLSLKETVTTGSGFTPIGTYDNRFKGIFDGDGTEIRNVYINSSEEYVGFFGYIEDANIYNIGLTGSIISSGNETGGIVACVSNTKQTKIANCYNKININFKDNHLDMAGIVGLVSHVNNLSVAELIIEDSYNAGNVMGGTGSFCGGIAGYVEAENKLTINRCYNLGTIKGEQAGGIMAYPNAGTSIKNVYNEGVLMAMPYFSGGIAGDSAFAKIENAYNAGKIKHEDSNADGGGIAGNLAEMNLFNCYNIGELDTNRLGEIAGTSYGSTGDTVFSKVYYIENRNPMIYDEGSSKITGESIAKPLSYIKSQAFVDELNSNIQGRDDLVKWKMGPKGYPILDI